VATLCTGYAPELAGPFGIGDVTSTTTSYRIESTNITNHYTYGMEWEIGSTTTSTSTSTTTSYHDFDTYSNAQRVVVRDGAVVQWDTVYLDPETFIPYYKNKSPQDRLKDIIASRQAPAFHRQRRNAWDRWGSPYHMPLDMVKDVKELRARETLRSVIGENKYKSFLKKGFVSVQNPKSKRIYQIYPGHDLTFVYEKGIMIERLCVHLRQGFPPTDSLIVRYLMAINNEEQLWKLANKHGPIARVTNHVSPDFRPLCQIYAELKGVA